MSSDDESFENIDHHLLEEVTSKKTNTSTSHLIPKFIFSPNSQDTEEPTAEVEQSTPPCAMTASPPRIIVIGAGIIGLSSAVELQQLFPGTTISIIASSFSPSITTAVAAGIWRPGSHTKFTVPGLEKQVFTSSFRRFTELARNQDCGIIRQSGFDVTRNASASPPSFKDIVRGFRELSREELDEFGKEYVKGWFYTTYGIQTTIFLKYLTDRFLANGGAFVQREVDSLDDLIEDYDVVVNCSGLGARKLVGDDKVIPVRGQIVRVNAPGVHHFFLDDEDYILLNRDFVVLGGTYEVGSWDLNVNEETAKRIVEKTKRIFPELQHAKVVSHLVGLRPFREEIRLEKEEKRAKNGQQTLVVHNYGHGGAGVTLSLGCAEQVGKIVNKYFQTHTIQSQIYEYLV